MEQVIFKKLHEDLKLSHHPFDRSLLYLEWAFENINFKDKRVLDVGGGNGIYSYYAKYKGAEYCLNLEPFAAGSGSIKIFGDSDYDELKIDFQPDTFQDFEIDREFDVIILHDSINHLDEANISLLHRDEKAYGIYSSLISKLRSLASTHCQVVIADCSRINFWGNLGLKNPVAPTIEWQIHQHPPLWIKLFEENGFVLEKLRWSPFKRFDRFGHPLSKLGFSISYFMQSHFNLVFRAVKV